MGIRHPGPPFRRPTEDHETRRSGAGWTQINAVLAPFGLGNGWAHVVRVSGDGSLVAYGVVNDGASPSSDATNDGSTVAMASH